jgi:RsiW-degrading membrane proteinase PrsW (M82 family)
MMGDAWLRNRILLRLIKGVLFTVLAGGLILGALIGIGFYANNAAEQAANQFCNAIQIGSESQRLIDRADQEKIRYYISNNHTQYNFIIQQGWIFNAGLCRVTVNNGQVVSVQSVLEGD